MPLLSVAVEESGDAVVVTLRTTTPGPAEAWWAPLTQPPWHAQWALFTADRDLAGTGPFGMIKLGDGAQDAAPVPADVTACEPDQLLAYTWGMAAETR